MKHNRRFYRNYSDTKLKSFNVSCDTTDLFIKADEDLTEISLEILHKIRNELNEHIKLKPSFLYSLKPLPLESSTPKIIQKMYQAGIAAGTGPMAAVAGAIAEIIGKELLKYSKEIIVENGGDIWIQMSRDTDIGLYVDNPFFKDKLAIKISNERMPCSICTSSSKLGHSLNFGNADSVTVVASCGALADAVATEACNRTKNEETMQAAVEFALSVEDVRACIAVWRDKMAIMGDIELVAPY